jgi:hypothetical protein
VVALRVVVEPLGPTVFLVTILGAKSAKVAAALTESLHGIAGLAMQHPEKTRAKVRVVCF